MRFLSSEAKKFKARTTAHVSSTYQYVIPQLKKDSPLAVTYCFYFNNEDVLNKTFGQKNGAKTRYKKMDVTDRIKLFEDAVFEALGLDDSLILAMSAYKFSTSLSGGEEKSIAIIEEIEGGKFGF